MKMLSLQILLVLIISAAACAQESISPRVDAAIGRGLEFLASQQKPEGAFQEGHQRSGITGLSVMAFLASGHTPGDGRYGQAVRKGSDFLIAQFPEDAYIGRTDNSRMYGQGIVTLALAELYGVERDEARQRAIFDWLQKSVRVIVAAQDVNKDANHAGGWRYEPNSPDSDLSLSGWNALALRSCNNIGITVDKTHIDRAAEYVLKCYRKEEKGFAYQVGQGATPGMTGVGVLNLYLMDRAEQPEVKGGVEYLASHAVDDNTRFPYYARYYVTHAAFQAGDKLWLQIWNKASEQLLASQMPDGGWPQSTSGEEAGRVYATAMAVLTLSAPNRLLPVHQR